MKFLYLHDPLLELLYEDDDIIAVDKPYGVDSHTNESKTGNEGFIVPGLIEIFETHLERRLHIIHRLDRTTTGVIIFGKSLESAKRYQQFFRNRESKKTYLFVTAARSKQATYETAQPILHKGAELEAKTSFMRLKVGSSFELWEAHPYTGRNHQIRIHGAQVGLPLLGDSKYGGAGFPFLCLHNRRLEFPNGVSIDSRAPVYFEDLELLTNRNLAHMYHEIDRRQRLFPKAFREHGLKNDSVRLLHFSGRGDEKAVLDLFDDSLSLTWNEETWSPASERDFESIARYLNKPMKVRFTNRQLKDKSGKPGEKLLGPEHDAAFDAVTGIFADQRLQRDWVVKNASGKTALNLFSSAGGYAIAAARGGASEITCVETSKSVLALARKNYERSRIGFANLKFLNRDPLAFLDQCKTKNQKFDLLICDAPSFSRGEKRNFKIESDLQELLNKALDALNPSGAFLFSTGSPAMFSNDIRIAILKAQSTLKLKNISVANIQSALDCELPGSISALKSFLIELKSPSF